MGRHSRVTDDDPTVDHLVPVRTGSWPVPGQTQAEARSTEAGDPLTTTGSHRAIGKAARRRIAAWPVVCGVLVVLLVAGWFGWNWADGVLATRAEAQATDCQEGNATIRVVVAPSATKPVAAAAKSWNDANTVVHGHCVHVDVHAVRSDHVLDDLLSGGKGAFIDGTAAAWLPESSSSAEELSGQRPGLIGSQPQSVASGSSGDYPYIGLAQDSVDDVEQRAAQSFRAYLLQPAQRAAFTEAGLNTP